ncbi:MAG: hypothetical protein KF745_10115 [Phycisphaeraceae bacterium]|nr:hypothetical protein [Phycisphaeraceae bacterium]
MEVPDRESEPRSGSPLAASLGSQLGGDLPCVVCGYNLRGVSIRSVCPECGTGVRATILAVVDPHATELQPIAWPRAMTIGLVMWSASALLAALLGWIPHASQLLAGAIDRPALEIQSSELTGLMGLCVVLSGIGAIAFVRPHRGLARRHIAAAAFAVALYIPLAWVVITLCEVDSARTGRYLTNWQPDPSRLVWRIVMAVLIAAISLGLRPNARALVARSLVLRSGRVDRQTLFALAAAALLAGGGDVVAYLSLSWSGAVAETMRLFAIILIVLGSSLLTLGLAGALVDCVRMGRAIIRPGPSIHDVLASGKPRAPEPPGGAATI